MDNVSVQQDQATVTVASVEEITTADVVEQQRMLLLLLDIEV